MNFRINVDKIITIIVTILIVGYLSIITVRQIDFSKFKNLKEKYINEIEKSAILDYVENHDNFYYKIDNAVYCITKEELRNSGEISYEVLDSMNSSIIEVKYEDGSFIIDFNDNCIEK